MIVYCRTRDSVADTTCVDDDSNLLTLLEPSVSENHQADTVDLEQATESRANGVEQSDVAI